MPHRVLNASRTRIIILSLATLSAFLASVEVLAFFAWLTDPSAALKMYSGASGYLFIAGRLDLAVFYAAYSLVVWLILILMASPFLERAYDRARRQVSSSSLMNVRQVRLGPAVLGAGLAAASALAALVAYVPYIFSQYPVGIDAHWYYEQLSALDGSVQFSQLLTEEARATYLLFLYVIRSITGLPVRDTVMLGSMTISVLFTLGSFLVVREMGQGDLASLLAGFFAGVSSQTLVGTLASIFSNWLAMAEMLFFFAFLLRAFRTGSKTALVVSFAIALAVMVTHPWTWPIVLLVLAIYVLISALEDRSWSTVRRSAGLRLLVVCLLASFIVFVIAGRLEVFRGTVSLGYSWVLLENLRPWRAPSLFIRDMQIALFNYSTQGLYSDWLLVGLAIVGIFALTRTGKETRALLESWVLGPSLLLLFLSPEIQWRLLFLIPYHVLAVLGVMTLFGLLRKSVSMRDCSYIDSRMIAIVQVGFVMFLMFLFLNNALRSMALVAAQISL